MRRSCACNALAALLLAGAAVAAPPAEERAAEAIDALLAQLQAQGLLADGNGMRIGRAARERYELGAVVTTRPSDGGAPEVLAITPGGAAERIGLQPGDRLLAINGVDLAGGAELAQRLRDALQKDGGALALRLRRGDALLDMAGRADVIALPAYELEIKPTAAASSDPRACARISIAARPPRARQLYPALLHRIDGRTPGPLESDVFRVSPGRHVLTISEMIDNDRFSDIENRQRFTLQGPARYKTLELDIQPNTTYRLAVRLINELRTPIRAQRYWEPVLWETRKEPCP